VQQVSSEEQLKTAGKKDVVLPLYFRMVGTTGNFSNSMRLEYVRLVIPGEVANYPHPFSLIINPSFNDRPVMLLNLTTMTVYFMHAFAEGVELVRLSSGREPNITDRNNLARYNIEPSFVSEHMRIAYDWRL
jgi:hypothetical protein